MQQHPTSLLAAVIIAVAIIPSAQNSERGLGIAAAATRSRAGEAESRPMAAGNAACTCPCAYNPVCDGTYNISDIIVVINVAFRGLPATFDPDCPNARTDVDCSGVTDYGDVMRYIGYVFRGCTAESQFCDPCGGPALSPWEEYLEPTGVERQPTGQIATRAGSALSNSIMIESKTVLPGATGVQVGVYVTNSVPLTGLILPFEIRSIDPDAFTASSLAFERVAGNRVDNSPLGSAGANWPAANVTQMTHRSPQTNICSGPTSNTFSGGGSLDYISPDALLHATVSMGDPSVGQETELDPGFDPLGSPSFRFAFNVTSTPGRFVFDTCCVAGGNHLAYVANGALGYCGDPAIVPLTFTPGTITIQGTNEPSCTQSSTDRYLLACPRGDIPFEVTLRNASYTPVPGYSTVSLDFGNCTSGEFLPKPGEYPSWPIVPAPAPSDADGKVTFSIAAGGNCADCSVTVRSGCGVIKTVPVRAVDVDGDAWVLPLDADSSQGICRDVNADGVVDVADLVRIAAHCCDHRYPTGACDWLSQRLETVSGLNFEAGDTIQLVYTVENNPTAGTCSIDRVEIYESPFSTEPTWSLVTSLFPSVILPRGGSYTNSIPYIVPSYGRMCLRALLYSSCCETAQEFVQCVGNAAECPPGAVCYEFLSRGLALADDTSFVANIPTGWVYYTDTRPPDTSVVIICTDDHTPIGTSGIVSVYYHLSTLGWRHFDYQVRQDWNNGDLCGGPNGTVDCEVGVLDVVCQINLCFRGGVLPIPNPVEHADINCDSIHDVIDVVLLINYAFRGGPPPPDCKAGPYWFD